MQRINVCAECDRRDGSSKWQEANAPTFYLAAMGFKKGSEQGAVTTNGGKDLIVQVILGP